MFWDRPRSIPRSKRLSLSPSPLSNLRQQSVEPAFHELQMHRRRGKEEGGAEAVPLLPHADIHVSVHSLKLHGAQTVVQRQRSGEAVQRAAHTRNTQ